MKCPTLFSAINNQTREGKKCLTLDKDFLYIQ